MACLSARSEELFHPPAPSRLARDALGDVDGELRQSEGFPGIARRRGATLGGHLLAQRPALIILAVFDENPAVRGAVALQAAAYGRGQTTG